MRAHNVHQIYLFVVILLLSGLAPSPATARQLNEPPPLRKHTWLTDPILIQYGAWGGDGAWPWQAQFAHSFVLYSDGRLITHGGGDYDRPIIYESQLSRRDICRLLYTIEQTGFFDLDFAKNESDPTAPYRYEAALGDERLKNLGEGGPSIVIKINAWQKVDAKFYMLGQLLYVLREASDVDEKTYVHPAISAIAEGIEGYRPHQLTLFQPAAVAISAGRVDGIPTGFISQSWPIRNIVLEKPPAEWPYVWIYRGPLAAQLYRQVLDNPYFYDRLDYHVVSVYPVFPQAKLLGSPDVPVEAPLPKRRNTCVPEDGLLNRPWGWQR